MDFGIAGKTAMVAAASKGIGLATAGALIDEGCRVCICGRNAETLQYAVDSLGENSRGFVADVSDPAMLIDWYDFTVGEFGNPEIVVTNTGGPPAGTVGSITDEQWQTGFDSTIMNVVRLVRLTSPAMATAGFGRIVHITSLVAKQPNPLLTISSTLRAGLMSLTRLQATEYAAKGITVNSVLPGHTMTDRQIHLAEIRAEQKGISVDEALKIQASETPIGRLADASEIGSAIAFLCSQQASYITGVNLLVDGGIVQGVG